MDIIISGNHLILDLIKNPPQDLSSMDNDAKIKVIFENLYRKDIKEK